MVYQVFKAGHDIRNSMMSSIGIGVCNNNNYTWHQGAYGHRDLGRRDGGEEGRLCSVLKGESENV